MDETRRKERPEERPYVIHVEGKDVTVQDTMVAGFTYRIKLEEHLGGPARVLQCYQSWAKLEKHSADMLTRVELRQAEAWLDAHRQARRAAKRFFTVPYAKTFVLRVIEF